MISSILSYPASKRLSRLGTWTRGLCRAEHRAEQRLVEHGEVEQIELDVDLVERRDGRDHDPGVLGTQGAGGGDQVAPQHAWVRMTTSALRPMVSSGSMNCASSMEAAVCVAPTSSPSRA